MLQGPLCFGGCNRDTPKKATERLQVAFSAPDVLHSGLWSLLEEFFFAYRHQKMLCTRRSEDSIPCPQHQSCQSSLRSAHVFIQRTRVGSSFCTGHSETSHPAHILLNHLIRTPCQSLPGVPNLSSSCSTPPLTLDTCSRDADRNQTHHKRDFALGWTF